MIYFVNLLGAIALIFWGTYMVKSGMLRTFGMSLRTTLSHRLSNRFKGFCAGFGLSTLLQSSTAATLLIAGLQSEGLVNTLVAISCIFGAELGSAFVACVLSLNFSAVAPLFILIGVVMFFRCKPSTRQGQFGRVILGLAFIMIAINQIVITTEPLRTSSQLEPFFDLLCDWPIISFAAGLIIACGCFSSLAAVIIASTLEAASVLNFDTSLWMVLGANAGSTLLALMTTMFASAAGRRGPSATALCRVILIALALVSLSIGVVNRIHLSGNIVVFHLLFNASIGLVGLLFAKPLVRFAETIFPVKQNEGQFTFTKNKLFAQENFLSVSISLSVAKKYLVSEIDGIRQSWLDVDTMLRSNPNQGNVMLMKQKNATLLSLNRNLSLFLNRSVSVNLNSLEAIQWQNLKSVNGTLKSAINLIEHTIDILDESKCRKHLDFSIEGLRELTGIHQLVLANIETLGSYLRSNNPEKKIELSRRLIEHQKKLQTIVKKQTLQHLQRIADNNENAIETDALHLEIQSLFNRVAGLICTSVNLELERN